MKIGKNGVLAGILLLGLLVVLTGCNLGGAEPDYWIEFTVDGTEYVFTAGYGDDPDDVAEGCVVTSTGKTRMAARDAGDDLKFATIQVVGTDAGAYADPPTAISFETNILGAMNLLHNTMTVGTDFSLTVTEYGPVGGVICGTFSGHVEDWSTDDVYALTGGTFCLKRHADNSISFE